MRSTYAVLLILTIAAPACDASLGSVAVHDTGSEGPTGDGDLGDGDGEPDSPVACIGGQLCPAGRSCSNGLCVLECSGEADCGADDYCGLDGLCHPKSIPSCNSNQQCAATQTCDNQICTATDVGGCDPDDFLQDGCDSNAVCVADFDEDQGTCYPMSACAAGNSCPIGLIGAVCNDGYLPSKDPICLIGLCATSAHCPSSWSCIRFNNAVLGDCSDGGFGSPCNDGGHCISGNCVPLPGLDGGFCG
jgi:hypothetical protein